MKILGLHHITLVSEDAQRTADFYTRVLGLRLIKKTVNFDDPTSYHLYFGDATGSPGTAITFFEWPHAPKGLRGIGGTHHLALRVHDYDGLLKWKRRLTDMNIKVSGPYDRHYFKSIYFTDPDGIILEIATDGPGFGVDEDDLGTHHIPPPEAMMVANRDEETIKALMWDEPVPHIAADMTLTQGMHHITAIGADIQRTDAFYQDVLGLKRVKMTDNFDDPDSAHWYWGDEDGNPGTLITYFERDPRKTRRAQMGRGLTHHFAFAVENEDMQRMYQARLTQAGFRVSQILDRDYFKSIYSQDPDGHIIELATLGPGFLRDEDEASLGTGLMLPAWLENQRSAIENKLKPINIEPWQAPQEAN
jgi:glyoxalase family protein